ncbi:ribonuclease H-like domain-containing protein [Tanacetum coccineum]
MDKRKKHFTNLRAEKIRINPLTKVQKRNQMSTYLRNMAGYKHTQLKNKSFEEIQMLFDKEMKRVDSFIPIDSEVVEGSGKKTESSRKETVSKKRASEELDEESVKRQNLEDDAEKAEIQLCLEIVPRDDEAVNVESLSTKYSIVDWKTHILAEDKMYYQIIMADGSEKYYKIFSAMLDDFDRQDVLDLYRLEDEIWKAQQDYTLISWRLFDSYGIHLLLTDTVITIHMLVERKYPLTQEMISRMLSRRLEVDHECEMAYELLRFTRSQLKKLLLLVIVSTVGEDCKKYSKSLLLLVVKLLLLVLVTTARRVSAVSYKCDNGTKFKNKEMNRFCERKGIKREFSVARTLQQNGVAERKNRTLIEAVRTMLADSRLPTTFWVEAVNTACYVQNRVLVTKPHNKTPYEPFLGRKPALGFMRPFGCPVTILNTIDHLGKFDGKDDEGLFVGYSINNKAFRVFNSRTRIVEENLHVQFSENTPNIAGSGPNWLFNIDALTKSETDIFDYETPLYLAFNEFNYLLKVDPDLLTKDIMGFKTYKDYKDDWIYEWNKNVPWNGQLIVGEMMVIVMEELFPVLTILETRSITKTLNGKDGRVMRFTTIIIMKENVKTKLMKKDMSYVVSKLVRVLDLEKTKSTQANEIASLKRRVKKLKKKNMSRTHKLKRLYKVGLTAKVESSRDEEILGEDASKQGRINAIDADDDITLVSVQDDVDKEMFDVDALDGEDVIIAGENENVVKEVVDAAQEARLDEEVALKLQVEFDEEERLAREKAKKEKEVNIALIETWDDIQAKIDVDYQLAERLQAQEQEELSDAEKATAFKRLNTFEDFRTELVEGKEKRAGTELAQEITKKQKVEDDKETAELKQCLEIIPDEEEVTIVAIPLVVKSPSIVDWKIHKEGRKSYYQIKRADGKSHA